MSTKKLTLRSETLTRASDQVMVLSANQINDTIYPLEIILPNENRIFFTDSSGEGTEDAGYIYMSSGNDLTIGNFAQGERILMLVKSLTAGTQRSVEFSVDNTTVLPQLVGQEGLRLVSSGTGADIWLLAPGDVNINPDGEIYVTTYERHIQIPARLSGTPANQPTQVDFFTAGGLQFATTGAKYSFFQWELPDDWDGTDIYVEVDWFADSAAMAGTDTVQWTVEYAAVAEGEVHGALSSVTLSISNSDDNARYKSIHSRMTLAFNDATQPLSKQDHIYFKVSRNTAVTNDFGGTVTVTAFEIIYKSKQIPRGN